MLATHLPDFTPNAPEHAEAITGALWNLALYVEDLKHDGPETANAAASVRAAEEALRQYLNNLSATDQGMASLEAQKTLQNLTDALKSALTYRMSLLFKRAAETGVIMPSSGAANSDPFSAPLAQLHSQAMQGQAENALKTLQDMEDMAEHMRQAGPEDVLNLAQTMKAQAEARLDRSALRDLIRRETELLDHTQQRLSAAHKAAQSTQDDEPTDISKMSTEDLLKQLGMQPPASSSNNKPSQTLPVDEKTVASQAPQRREDHALQRALTVLDGVLGQHTQDTTGKKAEAFDKAKADMLTARHALAERHDQDAAIAEQKVLDDLKQANQQMQKNQKSSSGDGQSKLSFIPPSPPSHKPDGSQKSSQQSQGNGDQSGSSDPDDDDDDDSGSGSSSGQSGAGKPSQGKNQDPLGRSMGEGHDGQDSDAHIPDKNTRDRARDIEQELRRRAADRTRPQSELDYLQRLLKSF
ncbi:hypothetical protein AA106555_0616 [Neokomagataea thailandica NBRC 106555]|uniref:DUF4175 domain-containing protein n=1 Tax=Neokomagataea thailandica NBRC 106555 TaxID=1223520 RepID=A0ABQ0QNL9_9PROT|nr:hypothetical protein AA106555_0616 [Neokomagataea thailandica NBRC 106555]